MENNVSDEWWDYIWSPRFLQIKNSSDPVVKKFAYKLAKSDGREDDLLAMGCMVFVEKSGFHVLQEILKGYPEDFRHKPEEVMLEAFRLPLDFWRGLDIMYGIDYDEICECDMMEIFDHVLSEVSAYFQNGGDAFSNEDILEDLCVLAEDVVVPDKTRLEALTLAEKYLQLDEKTKDLLETLRRGEEVTSE